MSDQLHHLITQWRAKAPESALESRDEYYAGQCCGILKCSDQLEALLAERPQPPDTSCDNDVGRSCRALWPTSRSSWCEGCLNTLIDPRTERPQPQEEQELFCLTCGHAHYFEADEAGFDSAEGIPWGKCKTCDCKAPNYNPSFEPLGSPTP